MSGFSQEVQAVILIQRFWRRYFQAKTEKALTKMKVKRKFITQELYDTEVVYVTALDVLMRHFYDPLTASIQASKIEMDKKTMSDIFMNIAQIRGVHDVIQKDLGAIVSNWSDEQQVGPCFLILAHFLKLYVEYCQNYDRSNDTLQQTMKNNKAFRSFVSNASANPEVGGQPLESFLIRPIQRIPRYNMMLHDLAANTWPSHPDYDPIHAAANVMQETAAFVNESVHRKERLDKVLEIQEKLIPAEYQLVKPSRIFVFQAEMLNFCLVTKQTTFSKHLKIRSEFPLVPLKVSVVGPKSSNGDNQNTILSFTSQDIRQQLEQEKLSSAPDPQPTSDDMKDAERYSVGDYEGRYLVEILTQNDWWMLDLEEEDRRKDFICRLIALVRRRVWELLQTKSPESEYVLNSAQVVDPRAESASPSPQVKSTTGRITRTGSEARPANVVVQPGTATGAFSLSSALKSAMEDIGSDPPPAVATPPNQSWRASLKPNSQPAGPLSRTPPPAPPPPRLQQNQPGMIAGGSQNPMLPQNKPLKMVPRTSNPVEPSSTLQNTRTSGKPVTLSSDLSHSPSVMKASMKLKQPAGSHLKHITPNVSILNQATEQKNEEMLEGVSKESLSRVQAAILKFSSGSSTPTLPFTISPKPLTHSTPTNQSPASTSLTPSRPSQSLPSSSQHSPASSLPSSSPPSSKPPPLPSNGPPSKPPPSAQAAASSKPEGTGMSIQERIRLLNMNAKQ